MLPAFARKQISVIIVWENTICYAREKYVLQNKREKYIYGSIIISSYSMNDWLQMNDSSPQEILIPKESGKGRGRQARKCAEIRWKIGINW